jgi:hypothetical protein
MFSVVDSSPYGLKLTVSGELSTAMGIMFAPDHPGVVVGSGTSHPSSSRVVGW